MIDFLSTLFLESAWRLGVFAFAAFAVALFLRQRMEPGTARSRVLPLLLMIFVVLFIVQSLVVTSRERILMRLDDFVRAIETPDTNALAGFIASNYDAENLDRDGFLDALRRWLDRVDVYDTRYRRRDVSVKGDMAEMTLGAIATVQIDRGNGQSHVGLWRIDWVNDAGEWRIRAIRIQMIDNIPIDQMRPYLP